MAHSDRHEDLVAAVALGMPVGEDRVELEAHLTAGCGRCEELLPEFREAATALAVDAPSVTPPPELRAKILASLGPARVASRPASAAPWRALTAAAALAAVLLLVDDASLRRQREELRSRSADLAARLQSSETELAQRVLRARVLESEDVQMLILGGKDPQPGARGRVFWSERARRGVLVASNLAPLPADRQYELWVFLKGKPVNAGVFDVDAEGRALFESSDFPDSQAQNFAVTIEPRGGVDAPTGPAVLVGSPA